MGPHQGAAPSAHVSPASSVVSCIYGRSVYSSARSVRRRDQIDALGWGRARTGTDAHLQESLCALPIPTGGHHTQRLPPSRPGGPKATTVRRRNSPPSSHGLVSLVAAPVCLPAHLLGSRRSRFSSIIKGCSRSIATVEANAPCRAGQSLLPLCSGSVHELPWRL